MVEPVEVCSDDDSDGKNIEPFQVSKGNEICFILFFCNCP